jgi:hypothetical protein
MRFYGVVSACPRSWSLHQLRGPRGTTLTLPASGFLRPDHLGRSSGDGVRSGVHSFKGWLSARFRASCDQDQGRQRCGNSLSLWAERSLRRSRKGREEMDEEAFDRYGDEERRTSCGVWLSSRGSALPIPSQWCWLGPGLTLQRRASSLPAAVRPRLPRGFCSRRGPVEDPRLTPNPHASPAHAL